MSDPEPPQWNPQPGPYGPPPPQPYDAPPQPYGAPPQHHAPPQHAPLPRYAPQQPPYAAPSQQVPSREAPPTQRLPYAAPPHQPQYGQPQQPYQGNPQQPYYAHPQQPYHGQPPGPRPRTSGKPPWFVVAAVVLVVALVGGLVAFLATRGNDEAAAGDPLPTATYSDGLTGSSSPSPTDSVSPTAPPAYTPDPTPTPTPERRRTLKDLDKGLLVYDDVYVDPLSGWTKVWQSKYGLVLRSKALGAVVTVIVAPVGYPSATNVVAVTDGLNRGAKLTSVRKAPVKTLRPSNSNIAEQAELSFTGRLKSGGVTVSVAGRCTSMTGVDSIHNVTVSFCVEVRRDLKDSVFRDGDRMLDSVARSI
ncbi:MAG: hypothetical protein HOV67_17320 [Kribbellaceae bacterium]|nr:hypothetical protein [Kribbellaceae bacterium]